MSFARCATGPENGRAPAGSTGGQGSQAADEILLQFYPRPDHAAPLAAAAAMKRYHFHIFDGHAYTWDHEGALLADLAAVVAEAETRARSAMRTGNSAQDWTRWKIDVRGHDDITIFHYPFREARETA
jgi:hypothetical protein